jgi:hypothetical protein
MHRGREHDHHPFNGAGASSGHDGSPAFGAGHNHVREPAGVAQWQAPHLDPSRRAQGDDAQGEPDIDQVEAACAEGFAAATDPTSFLRLANVPFEATAEDGTKLVLLRVEVDSVTDVGSVTPHLGGKSFRYDPLPAAMVGRRRRLRFIYYGHGGIRALKFAETRTLAGA